MEPIGGEARLIRFDRSDRVRLVLTGPDRAKFLQNLTTQDVLGLKPGEGAEAFVTSPQGKTLGYVSLHAFEESILLRTDAGGLEHVLPHFEKYAVFDDVEWSGQPSFWGPDALEWHLVGPGCARLLKTYGLEQSGDGTRTRHVRIQGWPILAIAETITPLPGLTLILPQLEADSFGRRLESVRNVGPESGDTARLELWRIAAGTPVFGRDVTPENLPQEVDRNDRAISFRKGCYLGQETVARLDALGHVNKILRGLELEPGLEPGAGPAALVSEDGKAAGRLTSWALEPGSTRGIALGYVRVAHAAPGRVLRYEAGDRSGTATVTHWPILGPTGPQESGTS